jgi:N-acetylglutamate synthase-like GNAT family acetyltransferase
MRNGIMSMRNRDPTGGECIIRTTLPSDAPEISRVIIHALRETNSRDYTPEIIARVERSFAPEAIRDFLTRRTMFTAEIAGQIMGTASLDQNVVRTVFVAPDAQGRGIGRRLMAAVIRKAQARHVAVLSVPSTVTAEPFYARLGFKAVRDSWHGDERTIIMQLRFAK